MAAMIVTGRDGSPFTLDAADVLTLERDYRASGGDYDDHRDACATRHARTGTSGLWSREAWDAIAATMIEETP